MTYDFIQHEGRQEDVQVSSCCRAPMKRTDVWSEGLSEYTCTACGFECQPTTADPTE